MFGKKNLPLIILFLALVVLPLTLLFIKQVQVNRSSAASPDDLETEAGVLSSIGVNKQTDSQASGGQFVSFQTSSTNPTPTPSTSSTGTYGPGFAFDAKNNHDIGPHGDISFRFKASTTSQILGVKPQWRSGPGYSGTVGNYGTINVSLRPDDGSGKPTEQILASVTVDMNSLLGTQWDDAMVRQVNFSSLYQVSAGSIYHIVFRNVHATPSTDYIAVNRMFYYEAPSTSGFLPLGRRQPHWPNSEFASLVRKPASTGSWAESTRDVPMLDVIYENGVHDGNAYNNVQKESNYARYIGGSNMVRERFTVTGGNKTVTKLWARVGRVSGTGLLNIRLETGPTSMTGNGLLVTNGGGNAPGSGVIANWYPKDVQEGSSGTWCYVTLPIPVNLINGQTYSLVLSAPSDTQYITFVALDEQATDNNNPMESYSFRDGRGEYSTNGGTNWSVAYGDWYHNNTQTFMEIQ
jgi:hypothetical protein